MSTPISFHFFIGGNQLAILDDLISFWWQLNFLFRIKKLPSALEKHSESWFIYLHIYMYVSSVCARHTGFTATTGQSDVWRLQKIIYEIRG